MNNQKAITLIELLCTLSIASILYFTAIPSFYSLLQSQRAYTTYYKLFTLIQYTRSKATFQGQDVILCPSIDQINCINNWQQPLMIFNDVNKNKRRDETEIIDRIENIDWPDYHIKWRASGSSRYLRFINDGSTVYQNGTFTLCPDTLNIANIKKIILYRSGRARPGRKNEINVSDCL